MLHTAKRPTLRSNVVVDGAVRRSVQAFQASWMAAAVIDPKIAI
jgi:hypothetical protein